MMLAQCLLFPAISGDGSFASVASSESEQFRRRQMLLSCKNEGVDLSFSSYTELNRAPDSARDAACPDVPGKQPSQHHIKQPVGAEIIGVYAFEGVGVAACVDQAEPVRTGTGKVPSNNFTALTVITSVRVSKTGDRGTQGVFDDLP